MAKPDGIALFFISAKDGGVYRCNLAGSFDEKVFDLKSTNDWDFLRFEEAPGDTNVWDLAAVKDRNRDHATVILPALTTAEHVAHRDAWGTQQYGGWGQAVRLGAATNSNWHFTYCNWPDIGFWGTCESNVYSGRIAFGTPFGGWEPRRIIQFPGEQLLVQLGEDQICFFDLRTKKVSLLRRGYGILAVPCENHESNRKPQAVQNGAQEE